MNIAVFSEKSGEFYIKPDNTLVRGESDFFVPDIVERISISGALVIKIQKAAKFISAGFAERYYREVGFGILIYPENLLENSSAISSGLPLSLDHTAYITDELIDKLSLNGEVNFSFGSFHFKYNVNCYSLDIANSAVEHISRYCSLKSGDLIFIELSKRTEVKITDAVSLNYSGRLSLDFLIR